MLSISSIMDTAASALTAQQTKIDVIANNLANMDTPGFKHSRVAIQDAAYRALSPIAEGEGSPGYDELGGGVRLAATQKVFSQGALHQTGQPLDLAIVGDGFFQVQLADDTTAYTRNGLFGLDADGRLVTMDGFYVLPNITVPSDASDVVVNSAGVVLAYTSDGAEPQTLGSLELARFPNPSGLIALGGNLYGATDASGEASIGQAGSDSFGQIAANALEEANVDIAEEMTGMMEAMRAYQISLKMVQTLDEMLSMANTVRR